MIENRRGVVEELGVVIISLLAIGIGWWGLTQFQYSQTLGLAALGFASFMLTPAAWLSARTAGAAFTGSAGAVMMILAAVLGSVRSLP
jgi:hypothetical protein